MGDFSQYINSLRAELSKNQEKHALNSPKITVIADINNTEKHLENFLFSLTKQTLKDIEIILTHKNFDDAYYIALTFSQYDSRIEIKDSCFSRKEILELANGEFIYFAKTKRTLKPDFLEVLYKNHHKPFSFTNFYLKKVKN